MWYMYINDSIFFYSSMNESYVYVLRCRRVFLPELVRFLGNLVGVKFPYSMAFNNRICFLAFSKLEHLENTFLVRLL